MIIKFKYSRKFPQQCERLPSYLQSVLFAILQHHIKSFNPVPIISTVTGQLLPKSNPISNQCHGYHILQLTVYPLWYTALQFADERRPKQLNDTHLLLLTESSTSFRFSSTQNSKGKQKKPLQ